MPDADTTAADHQRLTDLFRRHGNAIYAYASDRLSRDDAQDLVAEVFVVAWRRLETIRVGDERPWLFGVARRLLLQQHRHRADQSALQNRLNSTVEHDPGPGGGPLWEGRTEVVAALAKLPEADREALLLRYWYDLSSGESAKVLGCTAATFAVRLHRARRRFKKLYEAHSIDTHLVPDSSLTAYMRGLQ
ncbi:RNA polymerase sigma factor [Micromonospora arida]|uniref:RNA polymerase sigma factor n=1 Tax=Micromonospora arida TaxID=2203715 RepID=UPI001315A2A0|nr:sigma-70 family RNA polymerase sigma factor [Micromonospora arida]